MRSLQFLIFVVISANACVTSGVVQEPGDRTVVVDEQGAVKVHNDQLTTAVDLPAPVDKVWDAVTSTYAVLRVDRTLINRETGEQGNQKLLWSRQFDHKPVSTFINCGDSPFSGPNADLSPVDVSLVTRVRAKGTGTMITTVLSGTLMKPGANTGTIYCASTGALEHHLAEIVASRLNP